MQHYFVNYINHKIVFSSQDIFHIQKVMRMNKDDKIIVHFDNKVFLALITSINPLNISLIEEMNIDNELKKDVTLFFALAKGDKIPFVLQKATELGVKRIVLFSSSHCVSKMDIDDFNRKKERYLSIIKEAAEQSERNSLPEILGVYDINNIPKELLAKNNYVAYARTGEFASKIDISDSVSILIGPEGGLSKEEVSSLNKQGFKTISLGKRILRCETAAVYALSVIGYLIEQ